MSEVKNVVPQAGRAVTGPESRSIDKMGCSTDSGGSKQSTITGEPVRHQAGSPYSTTGSEETDNPFKRRSALLRTPPRARTGSLPDLNEITKAGQPCKRKRVERQKMPGNKLDDDSGNKGSLKDTLDSISIHVRRLEMIVGEMYKPKQELKDVAGKLLLEIEKLQSSELSEWANAKSAEVSNQDPGSLREIEDLRKQNAAYRDAQCDRCREGERKLNRRRQLTRDDSYETFRDITEDDWLDEIFPNVLERQDKIWEAPNDCALILPCSSDIRSPDKTVAKLIEKFGGREGLVKQEKGKGEVAMMLHSLGFPDNQGNFMNCSRVIYYPISAEGGSTNYEDDSMFQSIKLVRNHAIQHGTKKLAVPEMEGVTGAIMRRMLQFIFFNSNIEVTIHQEQASKAKGAQNIKNRPKSQTLGSTITKPKKPRQEALLVKKHNAQYSDILRMVKQKIDLVEIGVEVKDIKKTRSGELLLTVQNGTEKLEALKREISNKIPEVSTASLTAKKVLHIKDLDEVTTTDEIREAILAVTSADQEKIEIRALRPAYGNKQNVTVVLPETEAIKLTTAGRIKIGWLKCRVIERREELKCFRCWQYGHIKAQCKGPNRENLCLKCSQEGHKAANCKNTAYCIHCKEEGHQSGSPKCPAEVRRRTTNRPK